MAAFSSAPPVVTILMPTFNRARTLLRAVQSVVSQSETRWRLIIVDDGSTDDTAAVLAPVVARDRRITLLQQRNTGAAQARNAGLAHVESEWVAFLDSDDEYLPSHLAARVGTVARVDVDALWGGVRLLGPRDRQYVADLERPGHKIHLASCRLAGTLFAKASALRAVGGFRPLTFGEDHDLVTRLEAEFRVRRVPYRTYLYDLGGDDRVSEQARMEQRAALFEVKRAA